MSEISESLQEDTGRNPGRACGGVSNDKAGKDVICSDTDNLLERMVERNNMMTAYKKVVGNKGSAGVDNMTVNELGSHLKKDWVVVRKALQEGRYMPQKVLRVEIPKPGGKGMRLLGIPTVTDRLIQQALHQVLESIFDRDFSQGFLKAQLWFSEKPQRPSSGNSGSKVCSRR